VVQIRAWKEYRIEANGSRIRVTLYQSPRQQAGYVALQAHDSLIAHTVSQLAGVEAYVTTSVLVAVVQVREVGMAVTDRCVDVRVTVRLARRGAWFVGMLMVFVMDVGMRVFECLVLVLVIVALGEMKPHAHPHQDRGEVHLSRQRLA